MLAEACRHAALNASIICAAGDELRQAAERAAGEGRVLVAAGGDGTVSTVGSVAIRTGADFGVLPLGTRNHFARDAGIPLDVPSAIAVIAAGRIRLLDVGDVNGRPFVNNVSLGVYARVVCERQVEEARGRGRWTAFAIALARSWRSYRLMTVRLTADGRALMRRTPFVFVGNGDYRAEGLELGSRSSLETGQLSIFTAPEAGRFDALTLPFRALTRRLPSDGTFEGFSAGELMVETPDHQASVAVDGELMLARTPLCFAVHARRLRTFVP
jgi:diacylglycerol kinase family enzyme